MTIKILMAAPTQGGLGGMEQFYTTVAAFLNEDSSFEVRLLLKLVESYELTDVVSGMLSRTGLAWTTYRGPTKLPLADILWADIVYVQNPVPEICVAAKLLGKQLAVTIHNYLRRPWSMAGLRWRLSAHLASARWYNSSFVRASWEGFRPSRKSETFPTVSDLPMRMSPLAPRRGFVFVSRWIKNKGVEDLIEAYRGVGLDREIWPLVMMGGGELLDPIRRALDSHPIDGLTVLGPVSEGDKHFRIGSARWLVAAPNTNEDMGLTPLEARSQGVPCIVSRDGGLPEVKGPGALIVEPGDVKALRAALEQASRVPEAEYARIAHMTFEALGAELRLGDFYRNAFKSMVPNSKT